MTDDQPDQDSATLESSEAAAQTEAEAAEETVDFESYVFPDTLRRRICAIAFVILGAICVIVWVALSGRHEVVNIGVLAAGIALFAFAAYFFLAAFPMQLDQGEALIIASREIGYPVGHASAVLGWRGWRSRPTWRILLYSSEDPPAQRGLVEIDAIDGEVLGAYSEDNPEDWDALLQEEAERPG